MGNCVSGGCPCLHAFKKHQGKHGDAETNGGAKADTAAAADMVAVHAADNSQLNIFMRQHTPPGRSMSRASRTTSYRSARSTFDDGSSTGEKPSLDLERWASNGSDRPGSGCSSVPSGMSPLSGGSPGSCSPRERRHSGDGGNLTPGTLRKAWDAQSASSSKRRDPPSARPSFGGIAAIASFSRRQSTTRAAPAIQLHEHEKQEAAAHVDPAEYDAALLKVNNELFGHEASRLDDLPLLPVAAWNRRPGYLGHLSEEQEAALSALRAAFPASARFHTDHDLLRFLRARNFDLPAAEAMYTKYCSVYRERLMVSPAPIVRPTFGDWPLHAVELFPERPAHTTADMRKAFKCFLYVMVFGTDRLGRPVVYLRGADIVRNSMASWVPLAARISIQSAANELNRLLCTMASAKSGHQIEELMQARHPNTLCILPELKVVDVSGVSVLQMLKHIRSAENQIEFQHNSDFQPETLGKVVVVNAPFGAGQAWNLAKVFIPPSTRDKISICSSDYKAELLKHIDASKLPSCYGGDADFSWPEHARPKDEYDGKLDAHATA